MSDTHPAIAERFRQMLMARSGEERLRMGCSMHEAARRLVRASILAQNPDAGPQEIRRSLFLRFYGHEFDPTQRQKILTALDAAVLKVDDTCKKALPLWRPF